MAHAPIPLPGHRQKWLKKLYEEPWKLDGDTLDHIMDYLRQTGDLNRGDCWEIIVRRIAGRIRQETNPRSRLEGKLLLAVVQDRHQEAERLKKLLARLDETGLKVITDHFARKE